MCAGRTSSFFKGKTQTASRPGPCLLCFSSSGPSIDSGVAFVSVFDTSDLNFLPCATPDATSERASVCEFFCRIRTDRVARCSFYVGVFLSDGVPERISCLWLTINKPSHCTAACRALCSRDRQHWYVHVYNQINLRCTQTDQTDLAAHLQPKLKPAFTGGSKVHNGPFEFEQRFCFSDEA